MMNERIEELAEQAGLEFDDEVDLSFTPIYYLSQNDLYKFAELVVRECADIALREDHDPYECILKHFGFKND